MENQINNNISSPALNPQGNGGQIYKDVFYQLEQSIGADVQNVNNLVQKGIITQKQGQHKACADLRTDKWARKTDYLKEHYHRLRRGLFLFVGY